MIAEYRSPSGDILIGTRGGSLVLCDFVNRKGDIQKSIEKTRPDTSRADENYVEEVKRQLSEYFEGRRREFDLSLTLSGNQLEKNVYKALLTVGYGCTATYSDIAALAGRPRAVRAVASCIGRNPMAIIVPCHRIIGSDGKLHGYAGGVDVKRELLTLEGSLSC
ncbi:MAG: methylated-DNA--[protein]-cysteine S-methyltransferase [Duncaniella sp.]|nr:methylated-DNA--[protein]-cysteine S-methyltransferase [Duncaniella sp.]